MGTKEVSMSAKRSKPVGIAEYSAPAKSSKPNNVSAQAYYGAWPTPSHFFTSTVASLTPYAYLWRNQQQLMQPYGDQILYSALSHHEGLYTHPGVVAGAALTIPEAEGKIPSGMDMDSIDKCNGSSEDLGFVCRESGESEQVVASSIGKDYASHSVESGSKRLSDASDYNAGQVCKKEIFGTKKRSFEEMIADDVQNNCTAHCCGANPVSVPVNPDVPMPTTNLDVEMSLNASHAEALSMKMEPNACVSPVVASAKMVSCQDVLSKQGIQDEYELKKERRKQSNRESARRSRLRKQQEYEKLEETANTLRDETNRLKDEIKKISEDCLDLRNENDNILEELKQAYGPDEISAIEARNPAL